MARQLHDDSSTFEIQETDIPGIEQADPEVTYTLRPLTTKKYRELQKQHTKLVPNKQTRQMEQKLDGEGFTDALVEYVIADWRGVYDKGEEAPCSAENKQRLDGPTKAALVNVAGLNRIESADDDREQSFRPTA
jgi:hypothetical protein